MAINNVDSPNYKSFLESIDYDSDEVLKYFKGIKDKEINDLKKIESERDAEIASFYDEYLKSISIFEEMKYNILEKYFSEYSKINEDALNALNEIENTHIEKRNSLLSTISKQSMEIDSIKLKNQTDFFEAKKKYQKNIELVSRKMDLEYEKHMNIILNAKEKMLKNGEFFMLSDDHIEKIDKTISFLKEYSKYHKDISKLGIDSVRIDENKLSTYIEYLETLTKELDENRENLKKDYELVDNNLKEIEERLSNNETGIENDFNLAKREIKHTFTSLSNSLDECKKYFEKEIASTNDAAEIKLLKNTLKASIANINSRKERLSLDLLIENEITSRKNEATSSFKNTLSDVRKELEIEYKNRIDTNTDTSIRFLNRLKGAITNVLKNVEAYNGKTPEDLNYVHYCNKVLNSLEIDKKIESYELYKNHLVEIRKKNKDLDVIAFEILTSEELLAIKILELRKNFLIADDSLEVEKLRYEYKLRELKDTRNQRLILENSKNDIDSLRNELSGSKIIIKKELETKTSLLDRKRELDLLRAEYLIAYKRIDNIEKVISVEKNKKPLIDTLSSELKISGITELVLLDAISKKKEYELKIEKYEKAISDLDYKCDERIRYMNNVLEIVKNDFDEKKKEVTNKAKDLVKGYHPELRGIKKNAGRLIENTKSKYNKLIGKVNLRYENENKSFDSLIEKYNGLRTSFIDGSIEGISKISFNSETTSDSYSKVKSIIIDNLENYKKSYASLSSDPYFKNKVRGLKDANVIDSIESLNKKIKARISTGKDVEISKEYSILLERMTSSFDKNFDTLKNENKPFSEKARDKEIKNLKDSMNKDVANLVIKATMLETPSIESIYSINENRDSEIMEYEKSVSDYKTYYIETMDKLKEDYNNRYSNITDRIGELKALENGLNESMNKSILNAYSKIKEDNESSNNAYVSSLNALKQNSKQKSNELNNDIKKKDDSYIQETKQANKELNDYKNSIMEKVNKYKNYIEEVKRLDRIAYDRKVKSLENRKPSEFKTMEEGKEIDKAKFKSRKEKFILDAEKKKIDNLLEYGKKNDEIKKEILSIDTELKDIYQEFEDKCSSTSLEVDMKIESILKDIDRRLEESVRSIRELD